MQATLDRVASNEARFAAANDSIAALAGRLAPVPGVPFLCECPDPRCTEVAHLSLGEYGALRLFADRFLVAATCRRGERAGSVVVERNERYAVIERAQA